MLDQLPWKEVDFFEGDACLDILKETDFLSFAQKPQNKPYLFVHTETHPEDEKKVVAKHYYIADADVKQLFAFSKILVSLDEYDEIHSE